MKKMILGTAAVLAIAAAPLVAVAHGDGKTEGRHGERGMHGHHGEGMAGGMAWFG
jgi:hypothetical protein